MLSSKRKEAVRAVLYSQPTDNYTDNIDEVMITYTGNKRIRGNRINCKAGSASTYGLQVMNWKIEKIMDLTKNDKKIMAILDEDVDDKILAEMCGVTWNAVIIAKKKDRESPTAFGYKYYKRTYQIEKIAALVEA